MYRRLYFLFPRSDHVHSAVNQLLEMDIDQEHIHALSNSDIESRSLPATSARQRQDQAHFLERIAWRINLGVFAVAFLLLIYFGLTQHYQLAIGMLLIMLVTFVAGAIWARVPNADLREFQRPLQHDEILLMVDVPKKRVFEVGEKLHHRFPDAVAGGSSWSLPTFNL